MYMTMASVAPENVCFRFPEPESPDVRELSAWEIDAISGGRIDYGSVLRAGTFGAAIGGISGAAGGAVTGAFFGGVGAVPGALAGAAGGIVAGFVGGALTEIAIQFQWF